jgi:hypothetical protein
MTTERIDVLAQLRTTYCPPECFNAVAELIEAGLAALEHMEWSTQHGKAAHGRLINALSRVGGAK